MRIDNLVRHPDFVDTCASGQRAAGAADRTCRAGRSLVRLQSRHDEQRRAAAADVARRHAEAQQLESMRKDFVANASHELRSPLTVVSGYLEHFSDDPELERPGARRCARCAARPIACAHHRRPARAVALRSQRAAIRAGSRSTWPAMLALLRKDVLARPSSIRAVSTCSSNPDALLHRRRSRVALGSSRTWFRNAAKYTPPRGQHADPLVDGRGGRAHFACATPASASPAEHLPRLTERFYRVDPGRSREIGGSGLGLAIVKHALHRHGGRLEIDSEEGKGSTFTCHFPARTRPRHATARSVSAPGESAAHAVANCNQSVTNGAYKARHEAAASRRGRCGTILLSKTPRRDEP